MINLILFRVLAKSSEGRFGFICLPLKPCFWTIVEPEEMSASDDRIQDNTKPTLLRRLLHAECSLSSSPAFVFKPHLQNFHNKVIHAHLRKCHQLSEQERLVQLRHEATVNFSARPPIPLIFYFLHQLAAWHIIYNHAYLDFVS